MNKKQIIDDYLAGRHPIEEEKWPLPSEEELDRDEELFDRMLAEKQKKQTSPTSKALSNSHLGGENQAAKNSLPLWEDRGGSGVARWLWAAAAVLIAAVALFTWREQQPQEPTRQPEIVATNAIEEDTARDTAKHEVPHPAKPQSIPSTQIAQNTQNSLKNPRTQPAQDTPEPAVAASAPVLSNAADSLYYYLTLLENQMGDCRDSSCLAELTGLMRADERIKDLVNKIIHKQVETAYQEEYLIDTTTRYIPL